MKRFLQLSILYLLLLLISGVMAMGATWHVSPTGNDVTGDGSLGNPYATITKAISVSSPSDIIQLAAGTLTVATQVDINKANLIIQGVNNTTTKIQVSGTVTPLFLISASGVTIQDMEIEKTDKFGVQNIIGIQASNTTIQNNIIHGQYVFEDGDVSRAIVVSGGLSNLLIHGNTFYNLRQPAYISGVTTGTISNNYVYNTKGWVLEQGNMTFSNNTWGTNVYDIAILSGVNAAYYTDIVAMSNANNGAVIEDQRVSPAVLSVVRVDASTSFSSDLGGKYHPYSTIAPAITRCVTGGKILVAAGTYNEDIAISKTLKLEGAGAGTTTITGPIGGTGATVSISASNIEISGFTITRDGNNPTDWNNPGLNTAGLAIQGTTYTGTIIHDNMFTKNRTAIDINNSSGHTIRNNVITDNRTGLLFRNQTDNMVIVENEITNNWTLAIVFLDGSVGTNSPVQTALNCTIKNNNLSGNWYGQIVERQSGGSLPLPGTNLKNFSGNWLGTTSPVLTTANSTEPGYAVQIPVSCGGTATAPGGQPDICGPASANIDFTPYLNSGTDVNVETTIGRGTYGFQGDFSNLWASAASAQTGTTGRIQEAIDMVSGSTVNVVAGTYTENLTISSALNLLGPNFNISPNGGVRVAEAIIQPATSDPDPYSAGAVSIIYMNNSASGSSIKGFTLDGDNPGLTSIVTMNGANVDACEAISAYDGLSNVNVSNNIVKNINYSGIDFYNYNNGGAATTGNVINDNKFDNILPSVYGIAVLIYNNCYTNITNNVMTRVRAGIQTGNYSQADPGNSRSISNNKIEASRRGIFHNLAYSNASAFTLTNNTITAYSLSTEPQWDGILLSSLSVPSNSISNIINGSALNPIIPSQGYEIWNVKSNAPASIMEGSVTGVDIGVYANNFEGYNSNGGDGAHAVVTGLTISPKSTGTGILAYYSPSYTGSNPAPINVDAYNNFIIGGTDAIIYSETIAGVGQVSGIVNENSITGFSGFGLKSTISNPIDATCNWWGSLNPCDFISKISGNVNFQPYLTNGTDNSVTPGFQPVPGSCNGASGLVTNLNTSEFFCSIQAAIDDLQTSTGDIIQASDGTYNENVIINKSLTVRGENPPTNTSLITGTVTISADNVTFMNFKVDPPAFTGDGAAIFVTGNNSTIKNNIITGIDGNGTGTVKGIHIYAGSSTSPINGSVIRDNELMNISNTAGTGAGAVGITPQGWVSNVSIEYNKIHDINGGWAFGVDISPTAVTTPNTPTNINVLHNYFEKINKIYAPSGKPYPGVAVGIDKTSNGHFSDPTTYRINYNFFNGWTEMPFGVTNANATVTANAEFNWWGHCNGPTLTPYTTIYGSGSAGLVDYTPWLGSPISGGPALWLTPTMVIGDPDIALWPGVTCNGLNATMTSGNKQPAYVNNGVRFVSDYGDTKYGYSDMMEVVQNNDVTTSVTDKWNPSNLPKNLFVAFKTGSSVDDVDHDTYYRDGRQTICEFGDPLSGYGIYMVNSKLAFGMWNRFESKFIVYDPPTTSGSIYPLSATSNYMAHLEYEGGSFIGRLSNGTTTAKSPAIAFAGLSKNGADNSGIGGATRTRYHDYSTGETYSDEFDGILGDVMVYAAALTDPQTTEVYNYLGTRYGLASWAYPKRSDDDWKVYQQYDFTGDNAVSTAYPNPFVATTSFGVNLTSDMNVTIELIDATGSSVQSIYRGQLNKGIHDFTINGESLPSGMYFYRVQGDGFSLLGKAVLSK